MMKSWCLSLATIAAIGGVASAHTVYLDPFGAGGDVHPFFLNQGFNHLDLVAVEMFNEGGIVEVDILVNGSIQSGVGADWGKYLMFLDVRPGGRTDNPWGRSITTTSAADFYIGGWADGGGGAQLWEANGSGWTMLSQSGSPGAHVSVDLTNAASGAWSMSIDQAALGITGGQSILIDFATTAGGGADPGVDHLSLTTVATPDWGTGSTSGNFLKYEVEPAPGSLGVIGVAAMLAGRRRRI